MKLFIFKPSEDWNYCGGAVIFAAEKFENIQAMVDEEVKKEGPYGSFAEGCSTFLDGEPEPIPEEEKKGAENFAWVLAKTLEVVGDIPPGLVFVNTNYA